MITREEARTHARRNIVTRALGIEPSFAVDTWTLPLITGDRYILCSDGLVDEVTDEAIEKCVKQKIDPQKVADQLVAIANANGGRDNITVIVVDVIADGANSPTLSSITPTTTRQKKPLVRKLVISGTISVAAVVAIVLLSSYLRSGYFVAYENSDSDARVWIYRGKNFLWVNPTIEADSTLTRRDLSLGLAREITAQPSFSSSADARDYVNQIRDVVEQTKP
ncbi:MAG: PP2C family protein-serine/threonine phosphatase [Acidimicrobiaceae bacterium]